MSVIDCDVLVVGAGPAGAVSALYCAKHGLDTLLIEQHNRIGGNAPIRVDASPDFGLSQIIEELELKTENLVYDSRWYAPSGRFFTLHSRIGEYYFKRGSAATAFESTTVRTACRYGCRLLTGARIEEVISSPTGFEKVILADEAGNCMLKPTIIVGADGGTSLFHRYFADMPPPKKRVAYGVTGKDFGNPCTSEIYFEPRLAPGGYFYIVTCLDGLSSAGIVIDSHKGENAAERYFYDFLAENPILADKIKVSTHTFAGEGRLFRLNVHTQGNLLLVGEAAGLVDPLMGYGMMPAIVSGYYAGKSSVEAIKRGDCKMFEEYEREVRKRFNRRMDYLLSRLFGSFDTEDFEMLIKLANELKERTSVDNLLGRASLVGYFHALMTIARNLPKSRKVLVKSLRAACVSIGTPYR